MPALPIDRKGQSCPVGRRSCLIAWGTILGEVCFGRASAQTRVTCLEGLAGCPATSPSVPQPRPEGDWIARRYYQGEAPAHYPGIPFSFPSNVFPAEAMYGRQGMADGWAAVTRDMTAGFAFSHPRFSHMNFESDLVVDSDADRIRKVLSAEVSYPIDLLFPYIEPFAGRAALQFPIRRTSTIKQTLCMFFESSHFNEQTAGGRSIVPARIDMCSAMVAQRGTMHYFGLFFTPVKASRRREAAVSWYSYFPESEQLYFEPILSRVMGSFGR